MVLKKITKKILLIFMLLAFVISALPSYAISNKSQWSQDAVNYANECGIIPRGQYLGDYTIAIERGEIAELIINAYENVIGKEYTPESSPFSDTYSDAAYAVYELGIMNGKGEGIFDSYSYVTREEMAKIILSFKAAAENKKLNLSDDSYSSFADFEDISGWAKPYVCKASNEGIINGYDDGRFAPKDTVSWEAAIALVTRAVDLKTKSKPVITSLAQDEIISSNGGFEVAVSNVSGFCEVYMVDSASFYYASYIGGLNANQKLSVSGDRLKENSMYYVFAGCDGVFSDPIRIYTDKYNLFISCSFQTDGQNAKIMWNRIPGVEVYTINVTERRRSYYEDDIPPRETRTYEIRWEDFLNINTVANRRYIVEIYGGEYYGECEIYTEMQYGKDSYEISENYPQTKEEAEALMTTVKVPVWKLKGNKKVSSTANITVHYKIADKVKLVFEEIYNGEEQFPIKDVGGYSWRGGRSEHNGGTAIDINANENYCIYENGTVIGSHWKPYEDPYSITPYGDVIRAFEKYGFTWGGDAWRNPRDYMHFSYLGT